jgi:hypothetical protein
MKFFCRLILTAFETKLFPSANFTEEKFPSVSPLVLSDFLVVVLDIFC